MSKSGFYRESDLKKVHLSNKIPANHQKEALAKLKEWFKKQHTDSAGGILALPTGGGKTFTASRFLCSSLSHDTYDGPLAKGYKVLWLAHTHHLLEQAFSSLVVEIGRISEQKKQLNVRVVSPGHCPVHSIASSDDIVIIKLQALRGAYNRQDTQLEPFLNSAKDKLFVVFDEAHHSPAYTYRKLLLNLRDRFHNKLWLLGLTATPTYTDKNKRGWLKELFPQEVLYPEKGLDLVNHLIADRILAKPEFEQHRTSFDVEFDEQEYKKWVNTYRDLPEDIIEKLAKNEERNQFIAETYLKHKERYGKTIIFADRWYQCETLCKFLQKRGIKAGAIYSKVDNSPGGTLAENKKVLEQFRHGELDVIINIQMLTEGTDVPNASSVFLTRQTTSSILLTQMIGRGLRGSQFGGTDKAYIVSFIDNWKQVINWGRSDFSGDKNEEKIEYGKRPDLELISIELVRRWAEQVSKREKCTEPFVSLLPLGWYLIEFQTLISESEDNEIRQLLLVFDNEKNSYERFIENLTKFNIQEFAEIDVVFENKLAQLEGWKQKFFHNSKEYLGENLLRNIFHITRHIAQNDGEPPKWFDFEQRKDHDLDAIAQKVIEDDLGSTSENQKLKAEYERTDRYWNVIYNNFHRFKEQYYACKENILNPPELPQPNEKIDEDDEKVSKETKEEVKKRDNYRCLCCGEKRPNILQIDHIKPKYYGGSDSMDNLQTLCISCNKTKGIETIDFRIHKTPLKEPPSEFPNLEMPSLAQAGDKQQWEQFLHRSANFFYQCAAVKSVEMKNRGTYIYPWEICIYTGNYPRWLKPHLEKLTTKIRQQKQQGGFDTPYKIIMTGFDFEQIV